MYVILSIVLARLRVQNDSETRDTREPQLNPFDKTKFQGKTVSTQCLLLTVRILRKPRDFLRNPRYTYEFTLSLRFAESNTSPSFDVAETKKKLEICLWNLRAHTNKM